MKNMKKKTSIIFISALIISVFIGLTGCGESKIETENTPTGTDVPEGDMRAAGEIENGETEHESAENLPYRGYVFPENDYGGYEFKITSMVFDGAINDIVTERENGDVINDAIYKRNLIVEEELNITISNIQMPIGQMNAAIRNSVSAGDNAFDIAFCNIVDSADLANRGIFMNLFDIAALDIRSPWWDQKVIADVSISDKLYFCLSDITVQPNQLAWVIYFNKAIMKDLDLKEPYELVRKGEWTIDAMTELMKYAANDINGDGVFTQGDRFGFIAFDSASNAFLNGANVRPINKNAEDYPVLNPPSENDNLAADKIKELFSRDSGNFLPVAQGTETFSFMRREALFISNNMVIIDVIRDMDDDFGILPYPKLDARQDSYYSNMGMNSASFGIPATTPDIERVGVIMNAMTAVSMDTVRPAYFEYTLNRKRARDDESLDMLEIITSSRIFDVGLVYNWGGIATEYRNNVVQRKSESLSTVFEKFSGPAQTAIDKSMEIFMAIE